MEAVTNLICANCGKIFMRRTASVNEDLNRRNQTNHYGSRTCSGLAQRRRAQLGTLAFHAKVRGLARSAYSGPRVCAACGYSLHVDICHIRDVASFPDSATLAEVNAPSNLIALDKRCHWEFDHGHLAYTDGRFVPSWRVSDSNGSSGL